LEFGEVLRCIVRAVLVVVLKGERAYLGRVANLEEAGSAIEDYGQC
jgi:hypothetical protein